MNSQDRDNCFNKTVWHFPPEIAESPPFLYYFAPLLAVLRPSHPLRTVDREQMGEGLAARGG